MFDDVTMSGNVSADLSATADLTAVITQYPLRTMILLSAIIWLIIIYWVKKLFFNKEDKIYDNTKSIKNDVAEIKEKTTKIFNTLSVEHEKYSK